MNIVKKISMKDDRINRINGDRIDIKIFWSRWNQNRWKLVQKYSYLPYWICDCRKP